MVTAMAAYTFRDFLKDEKASRKFKSTRKFAEFLDVDPSWLTRVMSEKDPQAPGVELIAAAAKHTGVSLQYLLTLVYPELGPIFDFTAPSAESGVVSQQYEQAPEHIREAVRSIFRGGGK